MFYLLYKFKFLQSAVLLIASAFFCFVLFHNPLTFSYYDAFLPFAGYLAASIAAHEFLYKFLILGTALLAGVLLYRFFSKGNLTDSSCLFPVSWFLIFITGGGIFLPLSPVFITNLAILLLMNFNGDFHSERGKSQILFSGVVIGLATLYDLAALWLLVFIVCALIINHYGKFSDIMAVFIGFLLPYIYTFSIHFLSGTLTEYASSFSQIRLDFPLFHLSKNHAVIWISLAVFVALFPYLIFKLKMWYDNKLIIIRKRFLSMVLLAIATIAMILTSNVPFPYSMGYLAIPLSIFFSAFVPSKRVYPSREITLVLMTAAFILMCRW